MRDILVTLLVFGSMPYILKRPYIGILVWAWLSYMNPHRLSWGFAYSMPFAQMVALVLVAAIFFSHEKIGLKYDKLLAIWAVFLVWMGITTIFALNQSSATTGLIVIYKIQFLTILTLLLITNIERLQQLIWVIALSIGYFSVKGGVFTIMTGGGHRVWGPPGTFIEENNGLALATLMVVPLIAYLYKISDKKWVQYGLVFAGTMSVASAVGSQSRGAVLSLLAVAGFFWLKSSSKLVSGIVMAFVLVITFSVMPQSWHTRMQTITNFEEDESAMGRINAWKYSINVANDRVTGGGLKSWSYNNFLRYSPDFKLVVVAHSIYFSVLADHGWIGLILFMTILFMSWRMLSSVIAQTKGTDDPQKLGVLAAMLQVSLVAYMSGGAFLSLSYFDLPWHIIAMAYILKHNCGLEELNRLSNRESSGRMSSRRVLSR